MKVWFKKCWHRIVSLFCAAVIAFTTIAYSYPVLAVAGSVAAGAGSILAVLGVIGSIKEFCENCQWVWEIVEPIINKIKSSNASALAEQQEYYRCYWKEIVSKGQLTESKFREYWTFVVTNGDDTSMEAQYPGFTVLIQCLLKLLLLVFLLIHCVNQFFLIVLIIQLMKKIIRLFRGLHIKEMSLTIGANITNRMKTLLNIYGAIRVLIANLHILIL